MFAFQKEKKNSIIWNVFSIREISVKRDNQQSICIAGNIFNAIIIFFSETYPTADSHWCIYEIEKYFPNRLDFLSIGSSNLKPFLENCLKKCVVIHFSASISAWKAHEYGCGVHG